MKLCIDCNYYRSRRVLDGCSDLEVRGHFCIKFPDPVTGEVIGGALQSSCSRQRDGDFVESILNGTCGKRGRWWKLKS